MGVADVNIVIDLGGRRGIMHGLTQRQDQFSGGAVDRMSLHGFLGLVPPKADLAVENLERVDRGRYLPEKIRYSVGPDEFVSAFVCVPHDLTGPASAVFCHHQHASCFDLGKSEVVGLAGDPDQSYAHELAERSFVTIAPDAIGFEERNWSPDGASNVCWFALSTRLVRGPTPTAFMSNAVQHAAVDIQQNDIMS